MPSFLVLGFYLLLLPGYGEGSSPTTARGQVRFVFSMAALLKMRATSASTTSSV
jgi:hypothetical protein